MTKTHEDPNRVAAMEVWKLAHAKYTRALQDLLDAEKECVKAGVERGGRLDPVTQFDLLDETATHFECRTIEWACARSATTLVRLKRVNAPPELLASCKQLLQERALRLPVYWSETQQNQHDKDT